MLEHAKAMGFAVRQQGHSQARSGASMKAVPVGKGKVEAKPTAKKPAAKKATANKAGAKQVAAKKVPVLKASANKPVVTPAKKTEPARKSMAKFVAQGGVKGGDSLARSAGGSLRSPALQRPLNPQPAPTGSLKKLTGNLRKMGEKRPVKSASLRRALKSFLGPETADKSIDLALGELVAAGVVLISATSDVTYPGFAASGTDG